MGRVQDKVVMVTGGAKGLGKATCLLLAGEGAKVAVTDVDDEKGLEVAAEIERSNGVARYWHLDVTREAEVAKVIEGIVRSFGKIVGRVQVRDRQ